MKNAVMDLPVAIGLAVAADDFSRPDWWTSRLPGSVVAWEAALAHVTWRGVDLVARREVLGVNCTALFMDAPSADASVLALGLGPHVPGGERVMPVLAALLQAASILASHSDTDGQAAFVAWRPAALAYPPAVLDEQLRPFMAGGAFPALALVAITDQGGCAMTHGLTFFADQEVDLAAPALDRVGRARRLLRLIHAIATQGAWAGSDIIPGLDDGEHIALSPSGDGRLLSARLLTRKDAS